MRHCQMIDTNAHMTRYYRRDGVDVFRVGFPCIRARIRSRLPILGVPRLTGNKLLFVLLACAAAPLSLPAPRPARPRLHDKLPS